MNYKITIAYDGTAYKGWQMQGEHPTVQLTLSQALASIAGSPVVVHGAGRTDSGVHAEGQVASFRLRKEWAARTLRRAINGNLPWDIRVLQVEQVDDDFHARYSAKSKTYRYQIYNSEVMNPLLLRYAWHYPYALDLDRLKQDGTHLLGTHDFTTFTVAACETNTHVRTITDFRLQHHGSLLQLFFCGEGFVRYQVRTMVAALLELNRGRIAMPMAELIQCQQRKLIRGSSPAHGLTLLSVQY